MARSRYGPNVYENAPRVAAYQPEVRRELRRAATRLAGSAAQTLQAHEDQGHARILLERGRLDYFVILSDERGRHAAAAIEFGTRRSVPVAPLQLAISQHGQTSATRRFYGKSAVHQRSAARARRRGR